jgi:hypothetical protein
MSAKPSFKSCREHTVNWAALFECPWLARKAADPAFVVS